MPHSRKPHKGSFGSHFDELVEHFPDDHRPPKGGEAGKSKAGKSKADKRSVHERLLESAWRNPHDGERQSTR